MTHWDKRWDELGKQKPNSFALSIYTNYLKNCKKNINILDLGCGNGADSIFFDSKKFEKITALDYSAKALESLKETKIKTIKENILNAKFKLNQFDVIYSHLSLHYFDNKETKDIFNKIISWIKPNGYFFVKCKSTKDPLKDEICVGKNMYKPKKEGWMRHLFSLDYMKECLGNNEIIFLNETNHNYHGYDSFFIEAGINKGT